ncbi:hypothetical protein C4D60_Mb05t18640 [Musa balbisiana]|uniref:Calmodulin-binding domain-containing protein n=1 Tax=Musa balbisiana TaxID=52838 RepID=A0A4S8JX42_MUSBA|nr:hypothetical protein C4D60_Mb05t18640 [Musa balbisiana]
MDCMDSPELKLLKPEDINLVDTLELKSDGANVNFLQEKLLKLENIDVDALELKPSDDQPSQSATDDVEEIEKSKSASSKTTELDSEHEIKEDNDMDCMDSSELKLLKPEDNNLVNTLELKSDDADVNFLQEKLLKLENIDVDSLELKPSDDQPSQSATDDVEEIEESKSASSETTGLDSEHEIKEDNDMDCMDSPELKLLTPEDINLVDTLELKSDDADMNFLQEKLLKLENIDVDALELKPSDDQPSQSATDDVEEIEESKSASSETTELDSQNEIKEDNEMDCMDSPELKLLKPEDINLVETSELKSDGANVNFLQEKLLKLENIDVDALELKPSDDQPSQSATDDVEEIEESKSASSETTGLDSQNEIKEDNEMDCMDSPELKLLKPEDNNLVNTLELKSDDADVNFLQEKLLKLENIDVDALELKPSDDQPSQSATDDVEEIEESKSASSETTGLDSEHEIKEDNDMDCMDSPELKLLKPEDINLVDTLELKSDDADMNFLQEKLLKLENIDVDALELKPSDDQPSQSATDDVEEIEKSKSASSETTELDSQHEIKEDNEMDCMDSPELNLLKPEDINLVDTLELKSDGADVNFLQEKLLKLENIDVDALELKPSDDQPSQSATDDVEEIEKSKSASSETTELDSQHEIKEDNEMECMDSPELNLLKPEDINLVDTLELKSDGADVNFLQEKLLKLENIDVDALELKPSDDQPSQSATDDVEEIEKSKSASSETTELDSQHEIKEDNEMDCMDSPELNLLKPEDINLVDTLELKSDGADVNFLQEKLLKLENIDVDALELQPSDDQPSQSATDDVEETEESKSASSETTEWDSEHETKEDNDMGFIDSPKLKLLKPEDINLVDTLELKFDGADVNFLQETLLKLENIDVDALELKPSDDQPSQSATDDVEEIEKSESASSETTESDSEHEINKDSDNCESLKSEQKRIGRRDAIVHHREDEFSIPHKLKFTRGKAIELQPENNGPKRLRFRRGRMVGRNVNSSHLERENFRRSEMADVVTDSKPETQSIVLKHQDTQEKKDVRGLFNNVIEETTNKLVETRKSKVKALIGAFEIVISLQ